MLKIGTSPRIKHLKFLRVFAYIVAASFVHAPAEASGIPLQDLLNYFSATCRSYGEFSATALSKTDAIIASMKAAQNDPDCVTLTSAQSQLLAIQNSITSISQMDDSSIKYINYKTHEQALLSTLATTTDAATANNINEQLVELSKMLARVKPNQDYTQIANLVVRTNELMQQSADSYQCFVKRPGLLANVAGLASTVGSSVAAVNPALGVSISAGAGLLRNVVQQIRNLRFAKAGREFGEIKKREALSCVMEALSTDYCEADTTLKMIDWKLEHTGAIENPESSLYSTIRMMDREVPALLKWIEDARGATTAVTASDASRIGNIEYRDAQIRSFQTKAEGFLTERERILQTQKEYYAKWSYFKSSVAKLLSEELNIGNGVSSGGALLEIYNGDVALYYSIGITEDKLPQNSNGRVPFAQFDPKTSFATWPANTVNLREIENLSFDFVKVQIRTWVEAAKKITNAERARFAYPDLRGLFQDAFDTEKQQLKYPIAPYDALNHLIGLTRAILARDNITSDFKSFFQDTNRRLLAISIELERFKSGDPDEVEQSQILQRIFTQAKLDNGSLFITSRLDSLIRYAYVNLLKTPANDADRRIYAEALAATRFTEIFEAINPSKGLGDHRLDVERSKGIYQTTFETFVNHFQKDIAESLESLYEIEQQTKDAAYTNQRAQVCLFLMQAVEWPARIPFSYCEGLTAKIIPQKGAPQAPTITQALSDEPFTKRACLYRNLRRDTNIHLRRTQFERKVTQTSPLKF